MSTPREAIWAWLNSRLRIAWSDDFRGIGLVQNDCLKAAVGYNMFVGRACYMHGAIDGDITPNRTFREAILEYPFLELKLECVMGLVDSMNSRSRRIAQRLGFMEDFRFKDSGTAGCDLIHYSLHREEWKAQYESRRKRSQGT